MYSSTSSSEQPALPTWTTERWVLGALLLLLVVVEVGILAVEGRLSRDVAHLQEIPAILADHQEQPPPRLLLLGNSLVRTDIEPDTLAGEGQSAWSVAQIYPDDSAINDWDYLAHRFFATDADGALAVCFAEAQLRDVPTPNIRRLGRYVADTDDWPTVAALDAKTFEQQVSFWLAKGYATYALQERVRRRALAAALPGYRELATRLETPRRLTESSGPAPSPTYRHLQRLLDHAKENDRALCLVAMPVPNSYEVDAEVQRLAASAGVPIFNLQNPAEYAAADFPDGYHMRPAAAARCTIDLRERLQSWQPLSNQAAGGSSTQ